MKNAVLSFFLFLFSLNVFGQTQEQIELLEKELPYLTGVDLCEKAIELSELQLAVKAFDEATEAAVLAYTEAERIERKDYMAISLNLEAKSKIRNKKLKKGARLAAMKKLAKSLELMTKYGIENIELETDNIEGLIDASKSIARKVDRMEADEIVAITLDSIKDDLTALPKTSIKINWKEDETNEAVVGHILEKRKKQMELQEKIMTLNLAKVESEIKTVKTISTISEEKPAEAVEDLIILTELKEKWQPQKEILEKDFKEKVKRIEEMDGAEAKEELLLAGYKSKYDSLAFIHSLDSISLEKKEIALQQQAAKVEQQKAQRSLMMVGAGGSALLSFLLFFGFLQQRKNNRLLTEKNTEIQTEQDRSEKLLLNILPAEVAAELKQHGAAKAHHYDEATVLFSDFKNFSKIAEQLSPEKLIEELDYCFKAFDGITEKYKLEKIKTIGDAYLCAGGVPSPSEDHAERSVQAALEMQAFLKNWKKEKIEKGELFFEARIGIHTGPIIAGVVGVKKFAYDIWGDTVNIASRMESAGHVGKVNISEKTRELIGDAFNYTNRGKVAIKNKGEINMYFVEG